ncbi:Pepco domain-containing protein [Arthrobacter mobilis]|uniref:Pepco domain-containing protein n=1 Tax=Arthrobacter mobilis TaxID=2724944 RepID=A0A7X6K7K7_9MICC|nr:hypothetical protein [Arthrobacter mobilis]NKX56594.1 hypothetical protein [Arthrobacter mobilis]
MSENPARGRTLAILVAEEQKELAPPLPPTSGMAQQHGPGQWLRKWVVKDKKLDLSSVQEQLERVQSEVGEILEGLDTESKHGFGLAEVEVQVGISASGNLGVVSAGVEASLTLIYTR